MAMNKTTSKGAHPSLDCFSLDNLNQEIDNHSELTSLCCSEDLSQEDDFGIKLAADLYCYHTLDRSHPSPDENQELLELRLQIARQQEKLDILSSKLCQYELEKGTLKAEKAALIDERALTIQEHPITFSEGANDDDGSTQFLVNTNAKLMGDSARLKVVVDVMRKSFQSYIKDIRRCSDKDKQVIKTLKQNNELLNQRLCGCKNLKHTMSKRTGKTSLEWSSTEKKLEDLHIYYSPHSIQDIMRKESLHSGPTQEIKIGIAGNDCNMKGGKTKATNNGLVGERATGRKSIEVVILSKEPENTFANVDFRNSETRRPRQMDGSPCLAEETASRKSKNLRVDFNERTPKTSLEWSSTDNNQEDLQIDSSPHSTQDTMRNDSLRLGPSQEINIGISGDDFSIKGGKTRATNNGLGGERTAGRKTIEFISGKSSKITFAKVDFGKSESQRPRQMGRSRCLAEETSRRKSENLLVNFNENRRIHSMRKRWSIFTS